MDDDPQLTRNLKGLHDFGSKTHVFVMCLGWWLVVSLGQNGI